MSKRGAGCARVVVLAILFPLLLGATILLLGNLSRLATHDTATGVVVDLIESRDSDGDLTYAPVYEYEVDGSVYRYRSQVSYGGVVVPDIGDTRTILYNPGDPTDARVHSMLTLVWLPVLLLIVPLIIVFFIFRSMRRQRRLGEQAPPWADQIPPPQPPATGWEAPQSAATVIDATFMGTEPSQMDEQGRVRYRVKARAEIDGEIRRFRGEWLDEDPTLYYMEQGNRVEVRIDPDNPDSYQVMTPPSQ